MTKQTTTAKPRDGARPVFIRLPKSGTREPYTGLSRSAINALILPSEANRHKPPVASRVLRERGRLRGIRLIPLDDLIAYIDEQTPQEADISTGE